jgi:putative DNA methylase
MEYRKKLIEVALPLAAINAESAREKSIRHGHPSTLHLWWARRPLAACRAVLFASLVDDPDSDPQYTKPDGTLDEEAAGMKRADLFNLIEELVMWENSNNPGVIRSARSEIARCVASRHIETGKLTKDTVIWSVDKDMANSSKDEKQAIKQKTWTAWDIVTRCHCKPRHGMIDKKVGRVRFTFDVDRLPPAEVVNKFLTDHAPPVLDPFAGGGSIPLEAQRLGLRACASDLNPVPVLINKALIEIPPKFAGRPPVNPDWQSKSKEEKAAKIWNGAEGLAEDVRYYGKWMRDEAEKRIGHLYPRVEVTEEMTKDRLDLKPYVGQKLTVIAWLWARTIQCPNPSCRARTPLVRSFWLGKKKGKEFYAKPVLDYASKLVRFEIGTKGEPPRHTTDRTGARCLFCETFIKKQQLRDISIEHGIPEIPLAIVAEGVSERVYLAAEVHAIPSVPKPPVSFLEQPMTNDRRWFSPPLYGMPNFSDLFTARQLTALTTFCDLVETVRRKIIEYTLIEEREGDVRRLANSGAGATAYADAIATYLAFSVDRSADFWCALCTWANQPKNELVAHVFGRQALPMVWDFAEASPFSDSGGNFLKNLDFVVKAVNSMELLTQTGSVEQRDATAAFGVTKEALISTDPPYYDNIGYADLSDFFYVWLRRSLSQVYPTLLSTVLTPKTQELIASAHRHNGKKDVAQSFFETGLGRAFVRMLEAEHPDFPITVYYAFKQAETDDREDSDDDLPDKSVATASTGWETMLAGLIRSGFAVTGTWPIRTERPTGMKGVTNALASSIVLVCRPRPENASLATRKEFIMSLRRELPEALRNLQRGNIAPVDLAQAAIGPGMAVFTRYSKVVESDGKPMTVRTALGVINQSLDEVLAEQEGEFDGDTRWALAWFDQFGMDDGPFGDAETLSKAKNTAINGLQEAGVIMAKAGKVRLVKREELSATWNPTTDTRLTVWEVTQHLIHRLDQQGEIGAAELVSQLGGIAEVARDLAYRLYSTCERKKWAQEALAYNSLVVAWPELSKIARSVGAKEPNKMVQKEMF